jgi:2-acylglycerol O-acyltransferase 2
MSSEAQESKSKAVTNSKFDYSKDLILYDTKDEKYSKLRKITAIFTIFQGLLVYFTSLLTIIFIFSFSKITVSILISIQIYQYFFAKRSETYRKFLRYLKPQFYFNSFKLITEEELKKSNCLFTFHPHGVLSVTIPITCTLTEVFYKARFCVSRVMLNFPISGIFAKLLGGESVSKKNFISMMKNNDNIIFLPGGFEEATITDYHKNKVFIKNRTGFIKYALEFGYSIQPCYSFNENKLFLNFTGLEKFRLFLNKLKIPGTWFISKLGFMPHYNLDIAIVVGKRIDLPKIENPSEEEVKKYHEIYMKALTDLFYKYNDIYGDGNKLEIY